MLSFPVLLGVSGCLAVVAIYFLWVRKLLAKAPPQELAVKAPDAHP